MWSPEAIHAFGTTKQQLVDATLLASPQQDAFLVVFALPSDIAVGITLHQMMNQSWQPLSFFSKQLNFTQRNHNAYDYVLLPAYRNIKYLRIPFKTDHCSKVTSIALLQKPVKVCHWELQHLTFILLFLQPLSHKRGQLAHLTFIE